MERADTFIQEKVGLQPFDAIQLNHFKRVRLFLKNGLNPNMRDGQKRTLLMCACALVNQETGMKFVNLLLGYKAKIELTDASGLNALQHAVLNGNERIVSRFLEFSGNFDINSQDNDGNTALMLAVFTKDRTISEQIIKALRRYDLSVDVSNGNGVTPLIQATILDEDEIAKSLVAIGRASEQIRDTHFRKSASEWERLGSKRKSRLSNRYAARTRAIHTCPAGLLRHNARENGNMFPGLSRNAIATRYSQAWGTKSNRGSTESDRHRTESYQWPDLKRVYGLYEQQIASSYRRSAPPRAKTPPVPSEHTSEGISLWRKTATISNMRFKQRRHTIALTRSLPNNISTKFLFPRRSIPDARVDGRSSNAAMTELDDTKWPFLRAGYPKRNSLRRKSDFDAVLPATAPGELDSSLLAKRTGIQRRNSTSMENFRRPTVSFQSLEVGAGREGPAQALQAQPNSLKNGDYFPGETSLPIYEHEEEFVRSNDEEKSEHAKIG